MNPCPTAGGQPLPAGWCAFTDEQSLRTYYAHIPSGNVRWSPPPNPPPPPPMPPTQNPTHHVEHMIPHRVSEMTTAAHQFRPNNSWFTNAPMHAPPPPHTINRNFAPPPSSMYQTPARITHYSESASITNSSHQHNQTHVNHMAQQLEPAPMPSMNTNFQPRGLKRTPEQTQQFPHYHREKMFRMNGPPSKRACFGIPNHHRGNENGKDRRVKQCSACKNLCEWDQFSKRQWTSQDDVRKCNQCVKEMNADTGAGHTKNGTPLSGTSVDLTVEKVGSDSSLTTAEQPASSNDNRFKSCSMCKKACRWADFTKREWTSKDNVRMCTSCIEEIKEKEAAAELTTAKVSSDSSLTAERPVSKKAKMCALCKKLCDWADFSKTQWTSKDRVRKCYRCMEQTIKEKREGQVNELTIEKVSLDSSLTTEHAGQTLSMNHLKIEHISSSPVVSINPSFEPRGILRNAADQYSPPIYIKQNTVEDDGSLNCNGSQSDRTPSSNSNGSKVRMKYARADDTKKCSSCSKQFNCSQFSRRQWAYGDSKRKCNQCIEKAIMPKKHCDSSSSTTDKVKVDLSSVTITSDAPTPEIAKVEDSATSPAAAFSSAVEHAAPSLIK